MFCQYCKKKMVGRADKKFCSLKCKNDFHKDIRSSSKTIVDKVDTILHRNYAILLELSKDQKKKKIILSRILLEEMGFQFGYHTGIYKNSQGKLYHYVYDFAWMEFSSADVMVVKKN